LQRVAVRIDAEIGRLVVDRLVNAPLAVLEARGTAHWQTVMRDLEVVRNTFAGATALLLIDLPFAVGFLAVIWVLAPAIAWVFPVILAVFVALSWIAGMSLGKQQQAETKLIMDRDRLVTEIVQQRTIVKALGYHDTMKGLWEERHAATIRRSLERGVKSDTYINLGTVLTVLTTVVVTAVGALAIIGQQMTVGGLIAVNMLSGRVVQAFNQLFMGWRGYVVCRQSILRLAETIALPVEKPSAAVALEKPRGGLQVEGLVFRYPGSERPAIDDVSLSFAAPGLHAIVGRNGGGKTTLLKLLLGLYESEKGRVLLDGADLRQFSRREIASWIGYVPQEIVLFTGSIRDNIARGMPDVSDERIVAAATRARAHEFVVDLPDGYGSDVGEAGMRMSSGQRQRLTLARALVADPAVLVLDEPTSFLDRQAEQELIAALINLGRERNVVAVTHSMQLLTAASSVTVIEQGRVIAHGPPAEILPRITRPRAAPTPVNNATRAGT
jgi:ATP-binding cassette subfamily C protein LapB